MKERAIALPAAIAAVTAVTSRAIFTRLPTEKRKRREASRTVATVRPRGEAFHVEWEIGGSEDEGGQK